MEKASLTIRNIPVPVLACLRLRAKQNHRSMQGEILAILEGATEEPVRRTLAEAFVRMKATGITSDAKSAALIRADRNAR